MLRTLISTFGNMDVVLKDANTKLVFRSDVDVLFETIVKKGLSAWVLVDNISQEQPYSDHEILKFHTAVLTPLINSDNFFRIDKNLAVEHGLESVKGVAISFIGIKDGEARMVIDDGSFDVCKQIIDSMLESEGA